MAIHIASLRKRVFCTSVRMTLSVGLVMANRAFGSSFSSFQSSSLPSATRPSTEDATSQSSLEAVPPSISWMRSQMDAALSNGKITKEAYDYFNVSMSTHHETQALVHDTFEAVGDQDTKRMTKFQQSTIADRVMNVGAERVAKKMQSVLSEDQQIQKYSKDGSPTGESYWFEEAALVDPHIPEMVKGDILDDMRRSRRSDSPAFGDEAPPIGATSKMDPSPSSAGKAGSSTDGRSHTSQKKKLSFGLPD